MIIGFGPRATLSAEANAIKAADSSAALLRTKVEELPVLGDANTEQPWIGNEYVGRQAGIVGV